MRVLPRVGEGKAVIHLLNLGYEAQRDATRPLTDIALRVDLEALGVAGCDRARILSPDAPEAEVMIRDGRLVLPEVGLWTLVVLED